MNLLEKNKDNIKNGLVDIDDINKTMLSETLLRELYDISMNHNHVDYVTTMDEKTFKSMVKIIQPQKLDVIYSILTLDDYNKLDIINKLNCVVVAAINTSKAYFGSNILYMDLMHGLCGDEI